MIHINIKKKLFGAIGEFTLDLNFNINQGEFISIKGVSGSGKTTLLRILAGLENCDSGVISVDSKEWLNSEKKINLKPQKRDVGFLFQDYALFPNMTVLENLLFVKKDIKLAEELLETIEMRSFENIKPSLLSGGQKQRVALARALMKQPKLLLLDEPLSALDSRIKGKLQQNLLQLHKKFNITTILISHDLSEIYKLSNRVLLLKIGKIKSDGTPQEILLKNNKNNISKFNLWGEIIDIKKVDIINVAVISIGSQIVEVVLDSFESNNFKIGDQIEVSTKAFAPIVSKIK